MAKVPYVPLSVIRRLPRYLRCLEETEEDGVTTVSSADLGAKLDLNPAQIRKDLAYFGEFGRKGVGYDTSVLAERIRHILRLDRRLPVVLVGAGRLGTALCLYNHARAITLPITCVFDSDPSRIGQHIGPLQVLSADTMEAQIPAHDIRLAMIAVPTAAAQEVANRLVACKVAAILNFAPLALRVPAHVHLRHVDFTGELESLAYYIPE